MCILVLNGLMQTKQRKDTPSSSKNIWSQTLGEKGEGGGADITAFISVNAALMPAYLITRLP